MGGWKVFSLGRQTGIHSPKRGIQLAPAVTLTRPVLCSREVDTKVTWGLRAQPRRGGGQRREGETRELYLSFPREGRWWWKSRGRGGSTLAQTQGKFSAVKMAICWLCVSRGKQYSSAKLHDHRVPSRGAPRAQGGRESFPAHLSLPGWCSDAEWITQGYHLNPEASTGRDPETTNNQHLLKQPPRALQPISLRNAFFALITPEQASSLLDHSDTPLQLISFHTTEHIYVPLGWYFLNSSVHTNQLGILFKCRFQ